PWFRSTAHHTRPAPPPSKISLSAPSFLEIRPRPPFHDRSHGTSTFRRRAPWLTRGVEAPRHSCRRLRHVALGEPRHGSSLRERLDHVDERHGDVPVVP